MLVIRKIQGTHAKIPDEKVKSICIHEILIQTIGKYASLNLTAYPHMTNDPTRVIEFLENHYHLLSNPYSSAQDMVVQALASVLNHNDYLTIITDNNALFAHIIQAFHQNLNYNTILDCTVFKTPQNFLNPKPYTKTTYFLIIQTKPIMSDVSLIQNFSQINRKYLTNLSLLIMRRLCLHLCEMKNEERKQVGS